MFWDLPSDDFNNICGGGAYPIIRTVYQTLHDAGTSGPVTNTPTIGPLVTPTQSPTTGMVTKLLV